jgi:hypothetical protein
MNRPVASRLCRRWASAVVLAAVTAASLPPVAMAQTKTDISPAEEAAALSIVAKSKADAGDYATAAELYLQSYKLDNKEVGYLYSAARCEQKAGLHERAAQTYRSFLAYAPESHPARAKAEEYIKECDSQVALQRDQDRRRKEEERRKADKLAEDKRKEAEKVAAAKAAADKLASDKLAADKLAATLAKRQQEANAWRTPAGWAAVGVGIASLAGGSVLLAGGMGDRSDLQARLDKKDGSGLIVGISRKEALSIQSAADSDVTLGSALVGVGVALAGVGGYLLLSRPDAKVAVGPGGVMVSVGF